MLRLLKTAGTRNTWTWMPWFLNLQSDSAAHATLASTPPPCLSMVCAGHPADSMLETIHRLRHARLYILARSLGTKRACKITDAPAHVAYGPMHTATLFDHGPFELCLRVDNGRYDYISRRFLASVGQDCEYESKEIVIECGVDGSEHFSATGVRVTAEGFTVRFTVFDSVWKHWQNRSYWGVWSDCYVHPLPIGDCLCCGSW